MRNREIEERIVQYITGECSRIEAQEIEGWMAEDPAHAAYVADQTRIWEAAGSLPATWDTRPLWNRVRQRTERSAPLPARTAYAADRSGVRRRKQLVAWTTWTAAGMTVLVVGALSFLIGRLTEKPPEKAEITVRTIATEAGQRASIQLNDGTQVRLNVATRLTVPERFSETSREVQLEGEAYFVVAPDAARPFVINAGGSVVQVLGTSFDVRAYPEEPEVEVAVAEGKVALKATTLSSASTAFLTSGMVGSVLADSLINTRTVPNLNKYLAWTEGRLEFNGAPFDEVSRALERWYDLKIHLAAPYKKVDRLTASFRDESLSEILNSISIALNLQYEREGRIVTFLPEGSSEP